MKNIKNTLAATVLAVVMGVSTVSANAGFLVSDRGIGGENSLPTCESSNTGFLSSLMAIIYGRDGFLVSDRSANGCQSTQNRDGVMLAD
jgi:hypothetical protein